MSWLAFFILIFSLSWACVGIFRWYAINKGMVDKPNSRSCHIAPTPRGGGLVFFLGWFILLGTLYYYRILPQSYLWLFSPVILIGLIGSWDDFKSLSAGFRLGIHFLAASIGLILLGEGGSLLLPWLALPSPVCFLILVIAITWMINLYNFMDGSDGMAAMQSIFVFGIGGFLLFQYHAYELATLAWGLVALLGGFLAWNWPTAQIFMGDCGSCFLGFTISLFALISHHKFNMPLMIWIILTSLFWFDATLTLLRRILANDDWHKPHRLHAYQRLLQTGWSHQKVLIAAMIINAIISFFAWLVYHDPRLSLFSFSITLLLLFFLYVVIELINPMYASRYVKHRSQESN